MSKELKRRVHIPLYGGWIIIVITDASDITECAKRHFGTEDDLSSFSAAVLRENKKEQCRSYPVVLSVNSEHAPSFTPGLIAHESFHIVNRIYKDIGIWHDRDNDEGTCYLLSWIVNRICETKTKFDKIVTKPK